MKRGANKIEQSQILKGYEQGMSAAEISEILKIKLECVKSFAPKKPRKSKDEE